MVKTPSERKVSKYNRIESLLDPEEGELGLIKAMLMDCYDRMTYRTESTQKEINDAIDFIFSPRLNRFMDKYDLPLKPFDVRMELCRRLMKLIDKRGDYGTKHSSNLDKPYNRSEGERTEGTSKEDVQTSSEVSSRV